MRVEAHAKIVCSLDDVRNGFLAGIIDAGRSCTVAGALPKPGSGMV